MPKNSVTDPITNPEIAFAHLLLSGTMNDREAAEAAGLNPTTASYTKSKPRVREYMNQHRAAVSEKLIEQDVEAQRQFNIDRDQFLAHLWKLATLSPDATKGSITGQIKAMAMIGSMQAFLPERNHDRRSSANGQFAPPAVKPNVYVSEWLRQRQGEPAEPADSVTTMEAEPTNPPAPEPPDKPATETPSVQEHHNQTSPDDPDANLKGVSWAPNAIGPALDTYPTTTRSLRLPLGLGIGRFGRRR